MPANWDSLSIALTFIVPGFVLLSTLRALLPRRPATGSDLIISCLTASSLNYAVWFWLIHYLASSGFSKAHPFWAALLWSVVTLVSPILLGIILAHFNRKQYIDKMLRLLGFNPLHPIPTAWDYTFSSTKPCWILVTLKDESRIAGWWGENSFASDDPRERDLFISDVYQYHDKQPWERIPQQAGILIMADQITRIQFFTDVREEAENVPRRRRKRNTV